MQTFNELTATAQRTLPVTFRGGEIQVRGVGLGVMDMVRRLIPAPVPPRDAGGAINLADPDYLDMRAERDAKVASAQIAIGVGWRDSQGRAWEQLEQPQRAAWLKEAAAMCATELTDEEGMLLLSTVQEAGLNGGKRSVAPPTYSAVVTDASGSRTPIA